MKKYYEPEKVERIVGFEPVPEEVRAQFLRPGELLSILKEFPVAYQPIGTLEWHGRQNPLGCDALKAEALCIAAAKKTGGVVMPPLYFSTDAFRDLGNGMGCGMDATAGFQLPGSFYKIDNDILKNFLKQACSNYLDRGFRLVILVSGHNALMQQYLMDELCYEMKKAEGNEHVCFTMEYAVIEKGNPKRHSDHAGFYETSMMLLLHESRVNTAANDGHEPRELAINTQRPLEEASADEAREYLNLQIHGLVSFAKEKLERLKGEAYAN